MSRSAAEMSTPAWKIFHGVYMCRIPAAYTRSQEDLERFGTVTTGNKAYDAQLASELVTCGKTISQMAVLFDQGVDIILVQYETDARDIFETIQHHIHHIEREVNTSYAISPLVVDNQRIDAIVKDIKVLEQFAQAVYPTAKANLPGHLAGKSVVDRLMVFNQRNGALNQITRNEIVNIITPDQRAENLVSKQLVQRLRSWKN